MSELDLDDPRLDEAIADAAHLGYIAGVLIGRRRALGLALSDIDQRAGWRCGSAANFERLDGNTTVSALQQYARALGMRLELTLAVEGDRP